MSQLFNLNNVVKLALLFFVALLSACAMGPDYVKPTPLIHADMPAAFKENWKTAEPQDQAILEKWWTLFNDENLNTLVEQVATSNLTLAQAEANYRQALALVSNANAAFFPNLTGNAPVSRSKSASKPTSNSYQATLNGSWEMDLWGKIRRTVEVQKNTALSHFAQVQATLLSMQSQLAQNYFQLRVLDAQQELLGRAVDEYQRAFILTQHQYKAGVTATDSVLLAQTQLESTQAQALDVQIQRSKFEHAIAVLIGQTPSSFSISAIPMGHHDYMPEMPEIPIYIPSILLERRPDIAASERLVAAANAQIGVTKSAYFPVLTLSALGGYQSNSFFDWFNLPHRIWSVGPTLAATLFDGGAKRALNEEAMAAYDNSVATYRQNVLTAFQNVEDNLASLRILKEEYLIQKSAARSARKAVDIVMNQYKAGTVNYLNVVTAQTTALTNERAELTITSSRLVAAVQLITALGGGWTSNQEFKSP